jgi:hypothetical protein
MLGNSRVKRFPPGYPLNGLGHHPADLASVALPLEAINSPASNPCRTIRAARLSTQGVDFLSLRPSALRKTAYQNGLRLKESFVSHPIGV